MGALLSYRLLLWLAITSMASSLGFVARAATSSGFPYASFVFGDSLVDAGNNNYLRLTLSNARSLPNGIDYPAPNGQTPTGRFTNGLTIPDIIALRVGAPTFAPPYLAPTTHGKTILNGVNYASGGGGILNNTGRVFIQRLSLDVQISYFEETLKELNDILGYANASNFVAKSIVSVTIGANDFLDNYLIPVPATLDPIILSPQDFINLLITRYTAQLKRLYNDGARKFVIVNLPMVGCTPYQRSLQIGKKGVCSERANKLAAAFNVPLKKLLEDLNANLPGATFLYADAYSAMLDIFANTQKYGLENVDTACCGALGSRRGFIPCNSLEKQCTDRTKYFFWDPYHPTQTGYEILANEFLDGQKYISPMNIRQLVQV